MMDHKKILARVQYLKTSAVCICYRLHYISPQTIRRRFNVSRRMDRKGVRKAVKAGPRSTFSGKRQRKATLAIAQGLLIPPAGGGMGPAARRAPPRLGGGPHSHPPEHRNSGAAEHMTSGAAPRRPPLVSV